MRRSRAGHLTLLGLVRRITVCMVHSRENGLVVTVSIGVV